MAKSTEQSELVHYVHSGMKRILEKPIVVHTKEKVKSIDIFEHYRVERDENDCIKFFIKYGRHDDLSSEFVRYSFSADDLGDMASILKIKPRWEQKTHWPSYKWIFDIPLDSSYDFYNSFIRLFAF